jgi:type I restriction enzyme S subunit
VSSIDRLIRERCPDGVPLVAIGDFAELVRGNGMPKSDFVEEGIGCIHYGQIYTYYGTVARETISFVPEDKAAKLAKVEHGDLIVTNTSENLDDVCTAVAWLGQETIVTGGHATVLKHRENPEYLAYALQTESFHRRKKKFVTGTKVIDVSARNLARIEVPLPPLEVQNAIVQILSAMEQLEAELKAELEARRRQYAFYRGTLMESCLTQTAAGARLGDIVELKAGRFINAGQISSSPSREASVPCYGGGGFRGFVDLASHTDDHSLIGRQGALCGNVQYAEGPFYATEHAVVVSPGPTVDRRWIHHALVEMNLNQYASKSAQPGLAVGTLAELRVSPPSIERQRATAATLDTLDALVNDLKSGLPAEIAARRKQYEYYRDRLLTFESA